MKAAILLVLCFTLSLIVKGQIIDNTALGRNTGNSQSIRVNWENDFYVFADYYYTQGLQVECMHPIFRKNPLNLILIHPRNARKQYGLTIEQELYTPIDYTSPLIQYHDRPYASTLFLKSFIIATRANDRIVTSLSTGFLGTASGGMQTMTYVHKITNNYLPEGWNYQVANDLILNYEAKYERRLFNLSPYFLLAAEGTARAGTLSDKLRAGLTAMIGFFRQPFGIQTKPRKWQLYFYDYPQFDLIGYDATLQGGVFSSSIYTIPPGDVTRTVFRNIWGFVFRFKAFYLEYYETYTTKEFASGLDHKTGGVQIGFGIK